MTTSELSRAQFEMKIRHTPPPPMPMAALSLGESRRLLRASRTEGLREHAIVSLLLHWGMRASELVNIRITDLHLAPNHTPTLRITRLKKDKTKPPVVSVLELKPSVARLLKRWLRERPVTSEFVFPISRVHLYRIFRRIAEKANIPLNLAHPHVARHTVASGMIEQNISLPFVQKALGHSSILSTMRYVSVSDQQVSKAVLRTVSRLF